LPGGEPRAALTDSSSEDHDDRRQRSHGFTLHVNHEPTFGSGESLNAFRDRTCYNPSFWIDQEKICIDPENSS
jgi:hypothetical protein